MDTMNTVRDNCHRLLELADDDADALSGRLAWSDRPAKDIPLDLRFEQLSLLCSIAGRGAPHNRDIHRSNATNESQPDNIKGGPLHGQSKPEEDPISLAAEYRLRSEQRNYPTPISGSYGTRRAVCGW